MDYTFEELQHLLESKYQQFHSVGFIDSDPVSIPHRYSRKEDIEIAGFLAATIAWGQRKTIITNSLRLMNFMDNCPYEFITKAPESDFSRVENFVHRTFNSTDCIYFIHSLRNIYARHNGLQNVFEKGYSINNSIKSAIVNFRKVFFELPFLQRTTKHVANPEANSSAKRLNMFLRWMVRSDGNKVDFGLWNGIPTSALFMPLDVHTGNVSRKLGLLSRKQDDWKAVEELTITLRKFDSNDPVKYDYALFGMGVFEGV
jgi:uncharacterized protein (TIGR02757 family)